MYAKMVSIMIINLRSTVYHLLPHLDLRILNMNMDMMHSLKFDTFFTCTYGGIHFHISIEIVSVMVAISYS